MLTTSGSPIRSGSFIFFSAFITVPQRISIHAFTINRLSMATLPCERTGRCSLVQVGYELALAGDAELFRHPHQIGEGFGTQLLHDVGAMKFDGSLGGGEFAGDLFVQQSGGNERQHFALTRGELFVTLAQFSGLRSLFVRGSVPLD